jgi:GNAT superfamily N-acetyltransferase
LQHAPACANSSAGAHPHISVLDDIGTSHHAATAESSAGPSRVAPLDGARWPVNDVAVRDVRPDEAETLAELQAEASIAGLGHIFPADRYPFPFDAVREHWRRMVADDEARVLVAELEGRAVGVAAVQPEWLVGFYVVPACWGAGVAPRLHDDALAAVRALGSEQCHLWVLEHNGRARRFYERRGWRENGTTRVVPFPPNPIDVGYTVELYS